MKLFTSILAALVFGSFWAGANATSTEWVQHGDMLRTRIVVASVDEASDRLLLAWEADLAPGWKTYWRSPGEAGLPVRVSVDEKELELMYPVPERFEIFGITTYGYKDRVGLPFYVDRAQASNMKINASFMVCKEICVPFDSEYELIGELSDSSIHDIRIQSWMDRVPTTGEKAGLEISKIKVTGKPGRQRLVVDIIGSDSLTGADLLAEVGGVFEFGAPTVRLQGDGTSARFVLPVMTMQQQVDLKGQTVRFTVIDSKGNAIDRSVEISS